MSLSWMALIVGGLLLSGSPRAHSRGGHARRAKANCLKKGRGWAWDLRKRLCTRVKARVRCDSRRYACAGKRPSDYDSQVRITYRPGKGQDRACLARLRKAGIRFKLLLGVKGVKTPVLLARRIRLGRVRYIPHWSNKRRFILDCQMVEVLAVRGRAIRQAQVASVYYSSSWRYSIVKGTRRLSGHAYGQALDVTAIDGAFGYATLIKSYERGRWGCGNLNKTPKGKALRAFFCALKQGRAFRIIMGPDTDRYHRDHYHVEGPNPNIRLKPKTRGHARRRR